MSVTARKKHDPITALQFIRMIYLSAAAIIGLILFVIGASSGIRLWLAHTVFPSDNYTYNISYNSSPCDIKITPDGGKRIITNNQEIQNCKTKMKENNKKQAASSFNKQISNAIALIAVGLPVWLFHFWLMQFDRKRHKEI